MVGDMKILIYVQHLVGIGHLRRAMLLARAMNGLDLEAVVVSGGRPVSLFPEGRVRQLPAAQCRSDDFSVILDGNGRAVTEDWRRQRRKRLLEYFEQEDPDVLLLETFPFGRRQFRFELLPLLECARARSRPPRVICSIRDVLQRRSRERENETVQILNRLFDDVWVHGDPDWIRLEESFSSIGAVQPAVRYTGYVAESWRCGAAETGGDGIVVSAGGGAAGAVLMECAARARPLSANADRPWRFLVGGDVSPDQVERLAEQAGRDALVEPVRPDFKALLGGCRVSISQFGYNTAIDLMQTRARAVVVPFEGRGETEQRTRAEVLARKGLLELLPEAALTPQALAVSVDRAAQQYRPDPPAVDLDGAARSAGWLAFAGEAVSR